MLDANRKQAIDLVVARLSRLPGIENVQSDDWDSNGINVVWWLKASEMYGNRPLKFQVALREHNRNLKKAFEELGVNFRVTDYPEMKYEYNPARFRIVGDPARFKVGYDQSRFCIEVFV
jgi:hypothetical protein